MSLDAIVKELVKRAAKQFEKDFQEAIKDQLEPGAQPKKKKAPLAEGEKPRVGRPPKRLLSPEAEKEAKNRVINFLKANQNEKLAIGEIKDFTKLDKEVIFKILTDLMKIGKVERSGEKRLTKYQLIAEKKIEPTT